MNHFHSQNGEMYVENVRVAEIAKQYGTPCYIYSKATLEQHWQVCDEALAGHEHEVCYAVKANSNLAVLNVLAKLGSGFDVVSVGELERVLQAGGNPAKVVFSGVGKTAAEMVRALTVGIGCFNIESVSELLRLNQIAVQSHQIAPIAIRINPDIEAHTHPYIATGLKDNKFGIDIKQAAEIYALAAALPALKIIGIACHIGSQLTELEPFLEAAKCILALVETLETQGIKLQHVDFGGGLGVRYHEETPPQPAAYADALKKLVGNKNLTLVIEPGRVIAANAGILVTRVEYLKLTAHKNFAIVDAAMNDLLRPALYEAWHEITPVQYSTDVPTLIYDVVGPVCETSDFLGKNRDLAITEGDLLAIHSAGAYGFSMSSNYNSRPRVAEIMVDGSQAYLVRRRETIADLFATEKTLA